MRRITVSVVVRSYTDRKMIWTLKLITLAFLLLLGGQYNTFALQDVTADLFGPGNFGTVAAFGDFNSDKQTDIFTIKERRFTHPHFTQQTVSKASY